MLKNQSHLQEMIPSLFNEESSLCRLCGNLNQNGTYIFSEDEDSNLAHLINKYLPLRIKNDDSYPDRVCPGCTIQLEATKIFFDLIIEGQHKLKSIYDEMNRLEKNGNEIKTFEIQSVETGEKFFIQIFDEELYSEDHEMSKRINTLNGKGQKRGRPRKSNVEQSSNEAQRPQHNDNLEEEKNENTIQSDKKRHRKIPARFTETVQGKELDDIMKSEGIDEDALTSEQVLTILQNGQIIGRIENENGEKIGAPVTVRNFRKNDFVQRIHRRRRKYKCNKCSVEFRNQSRHRMHEMKCNKGTDQEETAKPQNKESCVDGKDEAPSESTQKCNESFESETDLNQHSERVHNLEATELACSECKETFSSAKLLEIHHKKCHDTWIHICEVCNKKFNHHSTLLYHRNSEHNRMRFVCNTCNKAFKHKQLLHRHQLVHTEIRPYKCDFCPSAFKTKANLYTHSSIHTGVKNHICSICEQKFAHKTSLNLHMRWHLGEKPYSCEICSKKFTQKGNLVEHKRIHTGEKPYGCEQCGKNFTTSSQLKLHIRSHTGEKPWTCDICAKSFSHRDSWKDHCRRHMNDQPFKCKLCPKSFTTSCRLKKHSLFHSGEKPYICTICSKGFSDNSNLIKHRKTHSTNPQKLEQQTKTEQKDNLLYVYYGAEDEQENIVGITPEILVENRDNMMEFQVVDQEGNILSLNTQDGQQINVITSLTNGEQKLQGILPDGTVVAIDLQDSKVESIQTSNNEIEGEHPVVSHLLLEENVTYLNDNIEKNETDVIVDEQSNLCFVTYDGSNQTDIL